MRYMLQPPPVPGLDEEMDDNFKDAVEVVVQYDCASASVLQGRLQVGYARAARIIDQLEATGVVGPADGANPREVLILFDFTYFQSFNRFYKLWSVISYITYSF